MTFRDAFSSSSFGQPSAITCWRSQLLELLLPGIQSLEKTSTRGIQRFVFAAATNHRRATIIGFLRSRDLRSRKSDWWMHYLSSERHKHTASIFSLSTLLCVFKWRVLVQREATKGCTDFKQKSALQPVSSVSMLGERWNHETRANLLCCLFFQLSGTASFPFWALYLFFSTDWRH